MHVCAWLRVVFKVFASLCADLRVPTRIHVLTDAPFSHAHAQTKKTAILCACFLCMHVLVRGNKHFESYASLCSTILCVPFSQPVFEVWMNTDARVQLRALCLGRYTPASKMYAYMRVCVCVRTRVIVEVRMHLHVLCTDLQSATSAFRHFYNQCLFNSFRQVIWLDCVSKVSLFRLRELTHCAGSFF
jgi:hypothetical protein